MSHCMNLVVFLPSHLSLHILEIIILYILKEMKMNTN